MLLKELFQSFAFTQPAHRRSHAGESIVMKLLVRNMFIRLKYIYLHLYLPHIFNLWHFKLDKTMTGKFQKSYKNFLM